nr:TIGR03943 family protein [Planosporangium thailandense]
MLLVGGAVLRSSLTDLYLRYVKQGLRPFLIAAGVLLVLAAVVTLRYEFRGGRGQDGHDHEHGPRAGWLLLLPVFALLLVAPPALGSYAANRTGTALTRVSDFPPLPAGDPARIGVLDYASRAVFDAGRSLGDRKVRLTGFVVKGADGAPYLARMVLSCCAADARPVKVGLAGDVPADLEPDTWLAVTGRYTRRSVADDVNGETIPYLDVVDLERVAAPTEEYES